ncbi:MAG: cell envelope integrity protein CreD [Clostridiales bacterium]|nr:cell envelope integrity protein CreD [Clostridiales bacterium]
MPVENKDARPMRIGMKILFMALITLGLMIPDLIIYGLSSDREDTQKETVNSISKSWSGPQLLSGPIISIPYSYKHNNETVSGTARILPQQLTATATIDAKVLSRSIYEATVYSGPVTIQGSIALGELKPLGIPMWAFQLDKARVTVGIGDLKGLESVSQLTLGDEKFTLNGTNDRSIYTNTTGDNNIFVSETSDDFVVTPSDTGWRYRNITSDGCLQAPLDLTTIVDSTATAELPFSMNMSLKGSQSIAIAPIGRENLITVNGNCKSPSFGGMFLPSDRKVKDGNFEAVWRLNSNNRDYPQAFDCDMSTEIAQSAVVVNMLVPVDRYQKVDRTLKYAFLVIILTFITILFCEIVARTPMYIFQYLLIGLALILFYSLLLSLVEHMAFGISYLIAATLTIGMVSIYVMGVLKSRRMALLTGGVLALMYIFIYVLMCLETYALLTGTIGLFLALAAVMYVSLKIKIVYTD